MIDFNNISEYRENNRIEAKKSLGGLPYSIWETVSSFANTLGGVILLGVVEKKDHSFEAIDLPDPDKLIKLFWKRMNNPRYISVNMLSGRDVYPLEVDGKHIVVINVPKAERFFRPVYIEGNPQQTYRRNGEGDYRCTPAEFQAMVRDASRQTQDMLVLEDLDMSALYKGSVRNYRKRMTFLRPGHVWEKLDDREFLAKIGAAGCDQDGNYHPTAAGLLMFGRTKDIMKVFPNYSLVYREQLGRSSKLTDTVVSASGDWTGNVYDFYFRVYERLLHEVEINDLPQSVAQALREALANCLVNADYYGDVGVDITRRSNTIILTNPGSLRIEKNAALSGGTSDPRNSALHKMFSLIDIGERTGSGIPNIFRVWREQKWSAPDVREEFGPARTTLQLP